MTYRTWSRIMPWVLVLSLASFIYREYLKKPVPKVDIASFEECAAAGYLILESYPERCNTPDGRSFTRVTPVASPSQVTLSGKYACLPKKDTGGPVTLECGFGLQTTAGFYALDLSSIPTANYPALVGNESITIEGYLVPIEMVSTDHWQTYDILGIISVDKVIKL